MHSLHSQESKKGTWFALLQMMAVLFLDCYVTRKIVQVMLKIVTHNHVLHSMFLANNFSVPSESQTFKTFSWLLNGKYAAKI